MTPRYAAFSRRLYAAEAARSAVCRDPRATDAEAGTYEAEYWGPGHAWAPAALANHVYERMDADEPGGWQSPAVKETVDVVKAAERRAHCEILRDLFGESFGPPGREGAWSPNGTGSRESWCLLPTPAIFEMRHEWMRWNGGSIPERARAIDEREDFDSLARLADALEEAGCTESAILDHLRGPGPHFRGCWALDLLMDR